MENNVQPGSANTENKMCMRLIMNSFLKESFERELQTIFGIDLKSHYHLLNRKIRLQFYDVLV